jgi:hypothetical protein
MATKKDYQAAADWAEHSMNLKPGSTTALRGEAAATRGRDVLAKALGGRPSIDPNAKPGQHARVRQVRVPTDIDTALTAFAARQKLKPSDVIRDALTSYLVTEGALNRGSASTARRPAASSTVKKKIRTKTSA